MRFSIWPTPESWDYVYGLTKHCEATGWDGMYQADHFMPPTDDGSAPEGNFVECWSVLAALAATVPRLRLAPLVTSLTYRHPAVLANIAATVDQVSGGRLLLGLGAGWQENEHAAYGIELYDTRARLDRVEEACAIVNSLLREPRTTFAGKHYQITDAPCDPKPVQARLPLLIGGGGEKRTLRIAAQHADEWNVWGTPELCKAKAEVLERHCADVGRDPSEIARSTQALLFLSEDESWLETKRGGVGGQAVIVGTPAEVVDIVGQYRDAGVGELIVPDFTLGPMARRKDTCDLLINEVASHFR